MGWKILTHSIGLLFRNWRDAIRISSPLIVLLGLAVALYGKSFFTDTQVITPGEGALSSALAVCGLWVAVAWHRYVLTEEDSGGWIPAFHGLRILSYLWRAVIIGAVLGLVVAIIVVVAGLIVAGLPVLAPLMMVVMFVITVGIFWAFYRFSPVLPAAALGKPMKMKDGWAATQPYSLSILATMFFALLLAVAAALAAASLSFVPIVGVIVMAFLNWVYAIVGISILTTIYGISVDGRTLD